MDTIGLSEIADSIDEPPTASAITLLCWTKSHLGRRISTRTSLISRISQSFSVLPCCIIMQGMHKSKRSPRRIGETSWKESRIHMYIPTVEYIHMYSTRWQLAPTWRKDVSM